MNWCIYICLPIISVLSHQDIITNTPSIRLLLDFDSSNMFITVSNLDTTELLDKPMYTLLIDDPVN